jgi:L-asparaginase/beta-aspartyl-peptidase (threonine type)
VARAVTQTPHWLITGGGAIAFARAAGFEDYYSVTERSVQIHRKVMAALLDKTEYDFQDEWRDFDWKLTWNFERRWEEVLKEYGASTIGSVAMDAEGHFAVCNSTGGSSPMLFGRVGDTPIVGAGYYCGPAGAIAATGIGEYIVKQMLCMTVYRWFETGMPLEDALHKGVRLFPNEIDIGLIAVTKDGPATADNRQMPTHKIVE